jgi:hypothetical protein
MTRIYRFSVITCNYWLRLFTVTYTQTDTCIIISRQKNIGYAKYLLLFFNSFQYFILFLHVFTKIVQELHVITSKKITFYAYLLTDHYIL